MPTTITFNHALNSSIQLGDSVYYSPPPSDTISSVPISCGVVTSVGIEQGTITVNGDVSLPGNGYFLFAKNIIANETSLKGYYADVKFKNNSSKKVNLFSIGSEVVFSSK